MLGETDLFVSADIVLLFNVFSADCCHQTATITAVDLAGNVGLCNVTITPNFVAPDSKLCENPASFNSTVSPL